MTRTGIIVLVSIAAAAGVALALAARSTEPVAADLLPPEAALLPGDAVYVIGLDVTAYVGSPLHERVAASSPAGPWMERMRRLGIEPGRDLQQMLVAGDGRTEGAAVAILLGRFDRRRVEDALARTPGFSPRKEQGRTIWVGAFAKGERESAVCVLGERLIVVGTTQATLAAIARPARGEGGLRGNLALRALTRQVRPGSAFWMCGDGSLLAMATGMGAGSAFRIPAIKTLVVSGEVLPELSASIVGEASDESTARGVADMVRGLVSIFALQSGRQPALGEVAAGISITQEASHVRVAARIRYDTLDKLRATPAR
jgi:hypothetical protein